MLLMTFMMNEPQNKIKFIAIRKGLVLEIWNLQSRYQL